LNIKLILYIFATENKNDLSRRNQKIHKKSTGRKLKSQKSRQQRNKIQMKKPLLTIFFTALAAPLLFAQDVITPKTGEDIPAKVLEVTQTDVKFKKFDNPDGPIFTLAKSDLVLIRYENNTKEIFTDPEKKNITQMVATQATAPPATGKELFIQGHQDARKYYKSYSGPGSATLAVSLLSPLAGLVPAVACSSTTPKEINLDYPNPELMRNADYRSGYLQKAKRIKAGRVWRNWGIGFGANILAVLLLSGSSSSQ